MEFKLKNTIKDFSPEGYVKESQTDKNSFLNDLELIDCSLGVNPFGHSTYIDNLNENTFQKFNISSYPQFPFLELKKEIIKYWVGHCKLDDNNIRFGTGSIGILLTINKIFIEKGTKVLGVGPTFTPYSSDVKLCEGIFNHVLLSENKNFRFNSDQFIPQINSEYALIYIDNPNNPTGQTIAIENIKQIVARAQEENICIVIDEAYGDFMDNSNSAVNLINDFDNLVVVRTFSKGFGLAGLRVGYMITSEYLSNIYSRVDIPFTVNNVGYTVAITAMKDSDFILCSRKKINEVKQKVRNSFQSIRVLETNNDVPIMTIEFPNKDVNLFKIFRDSGVLTESGEDFTGLGKNFVRMRIPDNHLKISSAIRNIEKKIRLLY